jgi:hypothetical protein
MEAVYSSETSVDIKRTTRRHIPEDGINMLQYTTSRFSFARGECFDREQISGSFVLKRHDSHFGQPKFTFTRGFDTEITLFRKGHGALGQFPSLSLQWIHIYCKNGVSDRIL